MKKILEFNPELAKNIWLEFSPQRLVLMPAVIGLATLSIVSNSASFDEAMKTAHSISAIGFIFVTLLAGIRAASRSLSNEQSAETWDWQRMSGIGAWKLATGKLFGGTSYYWYGGILCLIIYLGTLFTAENPMRDLTNALILVIMSIGLHGLAMLVTVPFMNQLGGRGRARTFLLYLILVLAAYAAFATYSAREAQLDAIPWFGMPLSLQTTLLLVVSFYSAWVIAGLYRTMRSELLFTDPPNWWMLFLVTNMIFESGFLLFIPEWTRGDAALFTLIVLVFQYQGLAYVMALTDGKDIVGWRKLLSEKTSLAVFRQLPLWTLTLGFSLGCAVLFLVLFVVAPPTGIALENVLRLTNGNMYNTIPFLIAVFAFVFRDLGILLLLNFSDRRRAGATMLILLGILYFLLPGILSQIQLTALVYPDPKGDPLLMVAFPLVEALAIFLLVRRKWNKENAMESASN